MDRDGTLARNVLAAPGMLATNVGAYFDTVAEFRPDAVISDFDSFAYLFAKRHGLPVISIDNQQIVSRCKLGKFAKSGREARLPADQGVRPRQAARLRPLRRHDVLRAAHPRASARPTRRSCRPSSARRSSTPGSAPAPGEHVLVYQTSTSDTKLLEELQTRARAEVRRLRPAQARRTRGNTHAQGVQRDRLRRRPRVRAGGRLQRRALAHRRGDLPRQADLQRARAQPVRAGAQRPLPRAARLRPRGAEDRRGAPPPLPRRGAEVRGAARAGTSRTETATSSPWSIA